MTYGQYNNGGAIRVRGEMEARSYPVAPGISVLFIDETQPYVYAKTMSLTPYEPPRFEKFRLVKEDEQGVAPTQTAENLAHARANDSGVQFVTQKDFDALRAKIEVIEDFIAKGKEGDK